MYWWIKIDIRLTSKTKAANNPEHRNDNERAQASNSEEYFLFQRVSVLYMYGAGLQAVLYANFPAPDSRLQSSVSALRQR